MTDTTIPATLPEVVIIERQPGGVATRWYHDAAFELAVGKHVLTPHAPAQEALEALRGQLERERAAAVKEALELSETIVRLTAERDAAREDARRYQHMKSSARFLDRNGPGLYWYLPRFQSGTPGERIDAAIDAAMNPSTQEPKS